MFRSTRSLHLPTRELPLSPDTTVVLHQVYNLLLGLLGRAKLYVDASVHGTTKLVQYFSFMTYCLISKTEKLMFSGYFMDLWNLFQVRFCFVRSVVFSHVAFPARMLKPDILSGQGVGDLTSKCKDMSCQSEALRNATTKTLMKPTSFSSDSSLAGVSAHLQYFS